MKISPRPWNAFSDADAAVGIIKVIFEKTNSIPGPLVNAYNETLPKGKPRVVERFYALLAQECPEALTYFVSKPE
jgi:hypothetical protein